MIDPFYQQRMLPKVKPPLPGKEGEAWILAGRGAQLSATSKTQNTIRSPTCGSRVRSLCRENLSPVSRVLTRVERRLLESCGAGCPDFRREPYPLRDRGGALIRAGAR